MKNITNLTLKVLLFIFILSQLVFAQKYKNFIGFEYRNTKDILKGFIKLPSTFFNQEMKFAVEIFKNKDSNKKFLFFQQYFTVEGNKSHRKILDIIVLELKNNSDHYSAMCFPNSNQQKDIIVGLLYTKRDIASSQVLAQPIKAWKTDFDKNKLVAIDPSNLKCLFGTSDDFPG